MTYFGTGDPADRRTDYTPGWLSNLADNVTMEASVTNGIVRGAEAVRDLLGFARTLYEYQEFHFVGAYGDNGIVEDYTSQVEGEPIGSVVVVRFNEKAEATEIVINHRPLRAVLLWSRRMGEHFAGTQYATYFLQPEDLESITREATAS